jgi:flagellar basal body-associated protein FliL
MKNKNIIITILLLIIVAGGAFFAGIKYQQKKIPSFAGQFANGQNLRSGNGQTRTGNAFRPVNGEIISADDKSITVKLQDGSSKIVLLSDSTQINKADTATKADLKVGETVAVFGSDNSDGSITAQNIQLNPILRLGMPTPTPTQ